MAACKMLWSTTIDFHYYKICLCSIVRKVGHYSWTVYLTQTYDGQNELHTNCWQWISWAHSRLAHNDAQGLIDERMCTDNVLCGWLWWITNLLQYSFYLEKLNTTYILQALISTRHCSEKSIFLLSARVVAMVLVRITSLIV